VTDALDPAEFLGIEVHELAWRLALIAPRRLARLQLAEAGKAEPLVMLGHCGRAASGSAGDLLAGPALAAQPDHLGNYGRWCGMRPPPCGRGPVGEASRAFGTKARQPFERGARRDAHCCSDRPRRPVQLQHASHQLGSAGRRQFGVPVQPHSHPARSTLAAYTITPGPMNNSHRLHS
jgi:hypothetical protein